MTTVRMYTKTYCPYCDRAKALLSHYDASVTEINVEEDLDAFQKLCLTTKMKTVPQIFIDDHFIGGYDQLSAQHQNGQLAQFFHTDSSEGEAQ